MSAHPAEHEELIARVLCGELAPTDAAVEARRGTCVECRDALAGLAELDADLVALGRAQREDLERARAEAGASDEARVRLSLEAALAGPAPRARPRPARRWLGWAAAAGLLLTAWLARGFLREPPPKTAPEILLSGGEIECYEPVGKRGTPDLFRWEDERPELGWFELTIRNVDGGKAGDELLPKITTHEPRWTPTPEQRRMLPAELYWEVRAFDAEGLASSEHGFGIASP